MTDALARTATGKEHEVAALKIFLGDRVALLILATGRTVEVDAHVLEYITGETGTVEGKGA